MRGEKDGPLFTRIRRFDTLTNDRLTDRAVYHVLQVRQRRRNCEMRAARFKANICDRHAG